MINKLLERILDKMDKQDEKLDTHLEKFEKVEERLDNIDKILERNTLQLAEHMRRSDANEQAIEILKNELQPIQIDRSNAKFLAKVVSWVVGSVSGIAVILQLLGKLF